MCFRSDSRPMSSCQAVILSFLFYAAHGVKAFSSRVILTFLTHTAVIRSFFGNSKVALHSKVFNGAQSAVDGVTGTLR